MVKVKYTKLELENIVKQSYSLAMVLRALGLVPRGGNYKVLQARKLLFAIFPGFLF
jgi:hypothetical protein